MILDGKNKSGSETSFYQIRKALDRRIEGFANKATGLCQTQKSNQ